MILSTILSENKRRWGIAAVSALAAGSVAPGVATAAAGFGPSVSVVVRGAGAGCATTVASDVSALGGRMTRQLNIIDGGSALVPTSAVTQLSAAPCVAEVTPDGALKPASIGGYDPTQDAGSLFNTTKLIGAQSAWAHGVTGKGIGVAVIDTGVAPVKGLNNAGQLINGADVSFDSQNAALTYNDEFGHGTHVAGIIAGNDIYGANAQSGNSQGGAAYAGNTSQFIGVAPDAHIISVKVGDESGVADVSQVIAALDWVDQHRNDNGLNIKVVNLSYGTTSGQAYTLDPIAFATEVVWRDNVTVVAAAGNGGSGSHGLTDPGYDPYVIAVGASDMQGSTVAAFSSWGDGIRNPDLVAPGTHIESLRDPGSNIDLQYGATATVGSRFFLGSGTSQATAIVSGAVALYLSAHGCTPDQVKRALVMSATPLASQPAAAQGAGELNLVGALAINPGGGAQSFARSTGTGSLEAARGGLHVVSGANGVALTGEQDIMGNAWNSAAIAHSEAGHNAWSGGTFNGAAWSGAGWSGAGWSGAGWSGAGWSGAGWSGAGWSGAGWSGAGWSGAGWSGAGWSDYSWS